MKRKLPPAIGSQLHGGFVGGTLMIKDKPHLLIVAPKADGEHEPIEYGPYGKLVRGANSFNDGRANTLAMARAGSDMAKWAVGLRIGGFKDWAIPARDQLERLYRAFKPTKESNYKRCGDNPSAIPPAYPYEDKSPKQTALRLFKAGAAEAFADNWYWSSTQYSAYSAWCQYFDHGCQGWGYEDGNGRVRAVRMIPL
ncbi:MAG: DUF1566 domain-containing protein [Gammaproteobacteria bacterium]